MPAKRRRLKCRQTASQRARQLYRDLPSAIDGCLILDEELAAELGREVLIAYPDLQEIRDSLSESA